MSHIVMNDGTKRTVKYNTAAQIEAIKNGYSMPHDKRQAEFVLQVQQVIFTHDAPPKHTPPKVSDIKVSKILNDGRLNGRQKARAIAKRLRERVQSTTEQSALVVAGSQNNKQIKGIDYAQRNRS